MKRIAVITRLVLVEMVRRKDVYVLLIVLAAIIVALLSLNIFNLGSQNTYVKDVALLLTWIMSIILAIGTSVRLLPQEEQRGTIFPLLSRPVTRTQLVCGKWLGAWISSSLGTLLCYATILALISIKGGSFPPALLAQALYFHLLAIGIITAIGIALSTRLNADAAAMLSGILVASSFLVVPKIPEMLPKASGTAVPLLHSLYWVLPHFDLFDWRRLLIHEYSGPIGFNDALFISVYAFGLMTASLLLAVAGYRSKRFSRTQMV